jgi:hypothetical protein
MSTSKVLFRDYPLINHKLLWTQLGVAIFIFVFGIVGLLLLERKTPFDLIYPLIGLAMIFTSLALLDQQLWRRFTPRVAIDEDGLKIKYHWFSKLVELKWNEIDHINLINSSPLVITKAKTHISFHSMDYFNQIDLSKDLKQKANKLNIPIKIENDSSA